MLVDPRTVLTDLFAILIILALALYLNSRLPWREAPRAVQIMVYGSLVLALGIALEALIAALLGAR